MRLTSTTAPTLALVVACCIGASHRTVAAQSTLDVTQAQEFLGHWLVNFESAQGSLAVEIEIRDEAGKVAASVTTIQLGTQEVTSVARAENTLTLQYEADAQGQLLPIRIDLSPSGEDLTVLLDIGLGQIAVEGRGTRMGG